MHFCLLRQVLLWSLFSPFEGLLVTCVSGLENQLQASQPGPPSQLARMSRSATGGKSIIRHTGLVQPQDPAATRKGSLTLSDSDCVFLNARYPELLLHSI